MTDAAAPRRQGGHPLLVFCALILPIAAALLLYARQVLRLPVDRLVQLVPDDAFYYLVLARNFAATGRWSFDGVAPASGFHPLFGYFVAALAWTAPGLTFHATATIIIGVSVTLVVAAFGLILAALPLSSRPALAAGAALLLCGPLVRDQCFFLMEAPFAIAAAAALVYCLLRPFAWGPACAIGLAGSLCRSDFVVLPAAMAATSLVLAALKRTHAAQVKAAVAALGGSLAGLGLVSIHSWLIGGSFEQSSVAIKRHWGALHGFDIEPLLAILKSMLGIYEFSDAVALLALGLTLVAAITIVCRQRAGGLDLPILGSCLAVPAYIVLYGFDAGSIQPWYFASFMIPAAMIATILISALPLSLRWAALAGLGITALIDCGRPVFLIWPQQLDMMRAGEMLRDDPSIAPVGAWNAGIIGYFAARPVTNLDGLVNDDAGPFILAGRLDDYVTQRGLRYILDFSGMFDNPVAVERGGYQDGALRRRAAPVRTLSGRTPQRYLTLYRITPAESAP